MNRRLFLQAAASITAIQSLPLAFPSEPRQQDVFIDWYGAYQPECGNGCFAEMRAKVGDGEWAVVRGEFSGPVVSFSLESDLVVTLDMDKPGHLTLTHSEVAA
jgi:hypothetical protein